MTELLICGASFKEDERARLETAYPSAYVDGPDDMASLDEATRAGIKAIAYKGHKPFGGEAMDLFPSLGVVANYGVGYDAIDVAAASARGVKVTNTPNVLNDDVADIAIGMLIAQFRTMMRGEAHVRSGDWAKQGEIPLNRKVTGASVGIVGLGRIGREIADRCAAFKMDIHYTSRSEKETPGWTYHSDVVAMAAAVDVLIIALVGGAETVGHVSKAAIDALGPRGVIINISRGTTVDEGALLDALEQGRIAGAGLDVFLNEPNIDPRFTALDNVVLQPHQGSGSVETRRAMAELQLENIANFLSGKDLVTPVN
ncbi:2-hydroxyacid dehydrogenase [Tropicibacter naphthalenivorans]|uniref:Glycerate dehydrogenase n=1 Tax=Tropicibacter naphthalenivorans TaxID=441103 RepID=A0A0P1GP92_9RHOB|nr:2-hydroxyacid dehydrogenase [Tropicibacter naphthalenivorans]CUH75973.1 Glycerate dehydrogenase [Tropicibacter naphthalenivorans]SMC40899.1 Lactate dehydrogenase [Tropicibacter naphthalenivorans]